MYEIYFIGRLLEELELADRAGNDSEREIHLQASRHFRALLTSPMTGTAPLEDPDKA